MPAHLARLAAAAALVATMSACAGQEPGPGQAQTPPVVGTHPAPTPSAAASTPPRPARVGEPVTVVREGGAVQVTVVRAVTVPTDEVTVSEQGRWLGVLVSVNAEGPLELAGADFAAVGRDGVHYGAVIGPQTTEQAVGPYLADGALTAGEVRAGAVVFDVPARPGAVTQVVYAPDGQVLASWAL